MQVIESMYVLSLSLIFFIPFQSISEKKIQVRLLGLQEGITVLRSRDDVQLQIKLDSHSNAPLTR